MSDPKPDEVRLRVLADECGLTGNLDLTREVRALLHAMAETKADPALLQ